MPTPPHILLYSGWQTCNIGDIGHTPGTLRLIEQFLPQAQTTLWLAHTNAAVDSMLATRFPHVSVVRGGLDDHGVADDIALRDAIDKCDIFIHNSGMHFNRFWAPPTTLLEAIRQRGKIYGVFGQSFDHIDVDNPALMRVLNDASFITCRDTRSLANVRSAGVTAGLVDFTPDGCFGIDVRDDPAADAFLRDHGLADVPFVTVTLRSNAAKLTGPGDALNPKMPTVQDQAEQLRWADVLIAVIEKLVRKQACRVLLAPEVDKEISAAKALIFDRLPADVRSSVVHRQTFWNVDEAASVYARARAVISMEPHSCIIALANATPAVHLFSQKHGLKAWMFADIGLGDWLIDIDAPDAADRASDAVSNALGRDARAALTRAMKLVEKSHREVLSRIGGMVDDRRAAGSQDVNASDVEH